MTELLLIGAGIVLINLSIAFVTGLLLGWTRAERHAAQIAAGRAQSAAKITERTWASRHALLARYARPSNLDDLFGGPPPEHDPDLPTGFRDDVVQADWPLKTLWIDRREGDKS
jgi:hypothetical protein